MMNRLSAFVANARYAWRLFRRLRREEAFKRELAKAFPLLETRIVHARFDGLDVVIMYEPPEVLTEPFRKKYPELQLEFHYRPPGTKED